MDAVGVAIETIFYQVFALGSKLLFTDAEAGRAGEICPEFEITWCLEEGQMLRAPAEYCVHNAVSVTPLMCPRTTTSTLSGAASRATRTFGSGSDTT